MQLSRLGRVRFGNFGVLGLAAGVVSASSCSGQRDASVGHSRADDSVDSAGQNNTAPIDASPAPLDGCPDLSLPFESLPLVGQGTVTIDAHPEGPPFPIALEVLQWPDQDTAVQWDWRIEQSVPEEDWDRSEIPAGACVIRLLNMADRCYNPEGSWLTTSSAPTMDGEPSATSWTRYDEYVGERPNLCSYAPGCQSSKFGGPIQWFYLREHGPDLYFVWCSQSCTVPDSMTVLGMSSASFDACGK